MSWLNFFFGSRVQSSPQSLYLWKMTRGPLEAHDKHPFKIRAGNFTLVTDAPQLRYHDGVTPGGVAIPLPVEVHADVLRQYNLKRA